MFEAPEVIAFGSLALAVVKLYLDTRSTKKDLNLAEQAISVLRDLATTYRDQIKVLRDSVSTNADIERQKILMRQEQLSWQKLKGLAKAASWFAKVLDE